MRLASLTLLLFCLARPAHALLVTPDAISTQLAGAALVADIEVENLQGVTDPTFAIVHRATSQILAVHRLAAEARDRAPASGDTIVITGPGGETGGTGVFLSGLPRPVKGQRYRAYLNPNADGTYRVAGFESGLVPLTAHRDYTRNRTDGSNGDGTGPFLFWDDSYFPIPYFISAPTFASSPDFIAAIDKSFTTWRNVSGTRFELVAMGCANVSQNANDGTNTVILVMSQWQFDPAAIAITRNFYVSGSSSKAGMILDSDILLNAVNHSFTTTGEQGKHDVQNIVTHEAGHFLSLGHDEPPNQDPQATMYAVASPGETNKRVLHPDDIAGITSAYPGAGNRYARGPVTAACVLGVPTSCIAAHHAGGGIPPLFGLDIGGAWLALLLLTGRWLAARLRRG